MKRNPVVHFEMPASDRERMADFYSKVFGWETHFFGKDMGNYVTVATTETDRNGIPVEPGSINGGFYPRSESLANCPSIVISVDDIEEHVRRVQDGGGQVIGKPVSIPGIGLFVSFKDTEGNTCSLLQAVMAEEEKVSIEDFESEA